MQLTRARRLLGWEPRLSNAETLCSTYDWYLDHLSEMRAAGTTHRVPWDQRALGLVGCSQRVALPSRADGRR